MIHLEEIERIVKWHCHSKSGSNRGNGNLTTCGLMWYNGIRKERLDMEEMFKEMMDKYQDIRRNGKILVDIQVPQVNSRIMNIKAEDGTIWYCRMMDGRYMI